MKFESFSEDKVCVTLNMNEDDMDLVINGKWELHIKTNEGNLSVDAYHVYNGDEDHDYDEDFISGLGWLSADDLELNEGEED